MMGARRTLSVALVAVAIVGSRIAGVGCHLFELAIDYRASSAWTLGVRTESARPSTPRTRTTRAAGVNVETAALTQGLHDAAAQRCAKRGYQQDKAQTVRQKPWRQQQGTRNQDTDAG